MGQENEFIAFCAINRKASGPLPRVPYDPLLYGESLASELNESAAQCTPTKASDRGPQFPLGASGDFNNVVKSMPQEMMIETRVYGPAHALRQKHDTLFHDVGAGEHANKIAYSSRHIELNLIRDDITFMPLLEKNIHDLDAVNIRVKPQKLIGKTFDASMILDAGHLSVRQQLRDRLIHINRSGSIIEAEAAKSPNVAAFFSDASGKAEVFIELDPIVNTQLSNALASFESFFQDACSENIKNNSMDNKYQEWSGYRRRHKMMLLSLTQKIKTRLRAIVNQDVANIQVMDANHPNIILSGGIDHLDIGLIQSALTDGADVNHVSNGRSSFQSVYARLCRMDSGDELNKNASAYENISDILCGWGCDFSNTDCEREWKGWAPIHYAAYYGHLKRVEWLIRCGASIHTRTSEGHTPLMLACEKGSFEKVYTLVKHGANFRERDPMERRVLHYAAAGGNLTLVQFLVQCGCVSDKLTHCQKGETPLTISARVNRDCHDYLSKVAIPKQSASPYIDKMLSMQSSGPLRGSILLKRGMRRKRQYQQ